MLQWINDRMKVFGWLFILPLAVVFVFWGVQGIVSFSTRQDKGLQVNGEAVNLETVRRAYQQQLAQLARVYPDEVPAAVRTDTQQRLVDEFVMTALIRQKTDDLKYVVTDDEVRRSVVSYPGFQVGGQFDKDSYFALLHAQGYTPERFEAEQRSLLKSRVLERALVITAFATPLELSRAVALKGETRETGYALLPLKKFLPGVKVDDAAVKAYYERHKASYQSPDTVRLSYVALRVGDAAKDVTVDDTALRAYYETVKQQFIEPEKRHARHILIQVAGNDAAAKAKAAEVYAEATAPGADFAALAKKYSQDAGSAAQGGDLGWAEKSFFVGPFADAVFAMKPGEIRGPIKTNFGWHVIKLEEIQAGSSKRYEEVKAALEPEYRKAEGERRFGEMQEKIEQLAFEQSGSLEPVAKELGLKVEEIPDFYKGLAGNELAGNAKVIAAAFSADVLGGQNSKAIELAPGNIVVLRASDRRPPAQESLDSVRARAGEAVRAELARAAAKRAAAEVAGALTSGATWEAALRPLGAPATVTPGKTPAPGALVLVPPKFIERTAADVPAEVRAAAFRAAAPAAGARSIGSVDLANGDVAVYAVAAVKAGVVAGDGQAEKRELEAASGDTDFSTYLAALRAQAEVHYSPTIFE